VKSDCDGSTIATQHGELVTRPSCGARTVVSSSARCASATVAIAACTGLGRGHGVDRTQRRALLVLRLCHRRRCVVHRRRGLVELLLRHVTLVGEWAQTLLGALREAMVGLGTADLLARDFGVGALRGDEPALAFERAARHADVGDRLVEREPVRHRVDLEQQIALAHEVVLVHRQLDDPAADRGSDVDDVGVDGRVVGRGTACSCSARLRRADHDDQRRRSAQRAARACPCLRWRPPRSQHDPSGPRQRRADHGDREVDEQLERQRLPEARAAEHHAGDDRAQHADQRAHEPGRKVRAGDGDRGRGRAATQDARRRKRREQGKSTAQLLHGLFRLRPSSSALSA
jgi:hypothetical protein